MRSLTFLLLISFLFSCETKPKVVLETKEITLYNLTKDSIIVFLTATNDTLGIYREIEILENENTDTLSLGYGIVHPGYVGKIWNSQTNLDQSTVAYIVKARGLDPSKTRSYAQLFQIGLWKKNYDRGFKKITLKLKLSTKPLKWKPK